MEEAGLNQKKGFPDTSMDRQYTSCLRLFCHISSEFPEKHLYIWKGVPVFFHRHGKFTANSHKIRLKIALGYGTV